MVWGGMPVSNIDRSFAMVDCRRYGLRYLSL